MDRIVISGTGLFTPPHAISNEELVDCFNNYVTYHNTHHGTNLLPSSVEFIVKASGIKNRFVLEKTGVLDIHRMKPHLRDKTPEETSYQCDMALPAAKQALENANLSPKDIDCVVVACSSTERAFPTISTELQSLLGVDGYSLDLRMACSSATFGIQFGVNAIKTQSSKGVLIVSPELSCAQMNYRDRESHFIFGDACTAIVLQPESACRSNQAFAILDMELKTQFSNNIRAGFGFLDIVNKENRDNSDRFFVQQGQKVFKDIVPLASQFITQHLLKNKISIQKVKRLWLHQANQRMNELIAEKILGRPAQGLDAPIILDKYANTGACGCLIAFHQHHNDFKTGDYGVLSSFGAGYSIGSALLQKV